MSIFKVFKAVAKVGEKITDAFENVVDFADHVIHKKEYERKARNRKIFWTILLSIIIHKYLGKMHYPLCRRLIRRKLKWINHKSKK